MRVKNLSTVTRVLGLVFLCCSPAAAQAQDQAPPKLQAALFMRLLPFYTNLGSGPFDIYVAGAPEVAEEFKFYIGRGVGKATLNSIIKGDGPPTDLDSIKVVYVGKDPGNITAFSQSEKVLSITGVPEFVQQGVTLVVVVESGKPKIHLNLSSTKAEKIDWNPAILEVAELIR